MKRRDFLTLLGGAAAAWPLAARAQQAGKIARVGVLSNGLDNPVAAYGYPIFLAELRKLGFTEGQNLVVEYRRVDEGMPKAFAAANELGAARVDVLVANGAEIALQAAAAVRPAVPIVMLANNFDPLARGYVSSLAHPGGNVTGLMFRQPELSVKQLELLVEAFPDRTRVGALWDLLSADQFAAAERAASSMHLSLRPFRLENPPYDFDGAFQAMVQDEVKMLLVLSSPLFTPYMVHIAELAIRHSLPSMFIFKQYVEAGGLMSYGVDTGPQWRRAASYVAKILRGAQPSELPVEQVDNFEFALNLKTAKAIGAVLPTSILLRADEVIE
ncbi:MAG TPA: ABC transporter substrate-binding protein [Xanthobacteraceae bacterium]|jgi:putative ABC transport system substrate-binding protein